MFYQSLEQFYRAGAGGAEFIWGPGAKAKNKFKLTFPAVSLEASRTKKS